MAFENCTHVTPTCPVEATTYGYIPDYAGNMLLLVIFAVCTVLQIGFGVWYRTWAFMIALAGGCVMELVGYIGRILMHDNVWNDSAFRQQVVCLIIAPSFIAAGFYLSLKHIILFLGPEHSRLEPQLYTWIFVGCDVLSILIQAAGGGIAAAAGKDKKNLLSTGNNMMIAGIAIQILTMIICGLLALDFAMRYFKHRALKNGFISQSKTDSEGYYPMFNKYRFPAFCFAEILAYVFILIRCIYRLPEMVGGWGNNLMRKESEFLILDGTMVLLASLLLTIFHPSIWFPRMTRRQTNPSPKKSHKDEKLTSQFGSGYHA